MVSATCQGSVDGFSHLSRFSWWFQPPVKVQLMVSATCQGSVDGFSHLSRFSWWFQPPVKVQLMVSATCQLIVVNFYELIWFNLGIMIDTIECYIFVLIFMTLTLIQWQNFDLDSRSQNVRKQKLLSQKRVCVCLCVCAHGCVLVWVLFLSLWHVYVLRSSPAFDVIDWCVCLLKLSTFVVSIVVTLYFVQWVLTLVTVFCRPLVFTVVPLIVADQTFSR